jgi:hypothetical protein
LAVSSGPSCRAAIYDPLEDTGKRVYAAIDPIGAVVKVSPEGPVGSTREGATMKGWLGSACAALVLAGCGDDSTQVLIDPEVEPFVGTWDAVVFTVTADAPPNTVVDVLTLGAFWIAIEPSGTYTATLEFPGAPPEIGKLTIDSGTQLTLEPNGGDPAPSEYDFAAPDSLVLDGATEFDFNLDRTDEPGQAHIELLRR